MDIPEYFVRLVRSIVGMPLEPGRPPLYDRLAMYKASVVNCAADGSTCDVRPEDKRISPEKLVRVRVGVPGVQAVVAPGAIVLMGWERGDPSRPYCVPSWESGATVTKLVVNAQAVYLGDGTLTPPINGVVVGSGIDAFTGATYAALGNASTAVMAKK
jgi:hypothetical protein